MKCTHQGPELGRIECPTCCGPKAEDGTAPPRTVLKVFACAVHGCCTDDRPLWPVQPGRYQVCKGCPNKTDPAVRTYQPLPEKWRRWIADGLLLGSNQSQMVQIIAQKFSYDVAVVEITAATNHPYVAAGLAAVEKMKGAKEVEAGSGPA